MILLYLKWKVNCQLNRLPNLPHPQPGGDPAVSHSEAYGFDPAFLGNAELPLASLSRIVCRGKNKPTSGACFSLQIWQFGIPAKKKLSLLQNLSVSAIPFCRARNLKSRNVF